MVVVSVVTVVVEVVTGSGWSCDSRDGRRTGLQPRVCLVVTVGLVVVTVVTVVARGFSPVSGSSWRS